MKKNLLFGLLVSSILFSCKDGGNVANYNVVKNEIRPPAYPLITIDPYTSGWSFTDNLYDGSTKHWTGKDLPMIGAIKVDNEVYRFMGTEDLELDALAKTSEYGAWTGKYTTDKPADTWMNKDFDASKWKEGPAAFGTKEEPTAKTEWTTEYIWTRRVVNLDSDLKGKNVYIEYSHDDDVILYVNGIKVVDTGNACKKNVLVKLPEEAVNSLVKGENVIAGYCYNRVGGGLLDYGLFVEKENSATLTKTATQKSVDVQATQTHYVFSCGNVDLKLTFTAPLLTDDLKLMSRPVNYISYEVQSTDNKAHDVQLYLEAASNWALDRAFQESESEGFDNGDLTFLKVGSTSQAVLGKKGDDVRIDWGYFYMATEKDKATTASIGDGKELRTNFVSGTPKASVEKKTGTGQKLAFTRSLGSVNKATAGKFLVGYDDLYSVQYFGENLRPYWNADGKGNIVDEFHKAKNEYAQLIEKCYKFDEKLMNDATAAGGKQYASLCAIAYRQAIAAHKLVEAPNKDLMFLSKENFSNGSIGTVDITYPSSPMFLYYNVELAKGLMNHIFYYSESGKWTKPFAAHDIGTYPLANGQTYGGDMPVEESGNMIITTAAVAAVEGNAEYAKKHWDVLTVWTDYLVENGLDPENQLCTDDFAGHFAHNTNLSIKAIVAIASYGKLAGMLDKKDVAEKYTNIAKDMAAKWVKMADDGDHYRLTFDQAGTWSQKYNLVWDKILKMGIFPADVAKKDIAYYLTKQNKYGLPLDNREDYTKTDWIIWTATMADDQATFEKFIAPVYLFMNETTDRVPMSDWVFTSTPKQRGFQARSVVGGYFIKMLDVKQNQKK